MKRDVLITVTGLLFTGNGEDEKDYIDVITPGLCYSRGEEIFLFYEEQMEGFEEPVRNRVSLRPGRAVITKKGLVTAEMIFEPGKNTTSWYSTPFGKLDLSVHTSRISLKESPDRIEADIRYELFLNGGQANRCFVKILVQPQGEDSSFILAV